MEKYFTTKRISLKLKGFGFNENCVAHFNDNNELIIHGDEIPFNEHKFSSPMYEQVIDWLYDNYSMKIDTLKTADPAITPYYSVFIYGNVRVYGITQKLNGGLLKEDGSHFNRHNIFGTTHKKMGVLREQRNNTLENVILMSLEYIEKFNHIIYNEPIIQGYSDGTVKTWKSIVDICEKGDFPNYVLQNINPTYILSKLIKQWEEKTTKYMVIVDGMNTFMGGDNLSNGVHYVQGKFYLKFSGDTHKILFDLISHSEIEGRIFREYNDLKM